MNPQLLSFSATQSAANTTTTTTQAIPRIILPSSGRAQAMEILKIFLEFSVFESIASATETDDSVRVILSTTSFGTTATNFEEPRVFAGYFRDRLGAFSAGGTYGYPNSNSVMIDLTDGAGHGILVATDNIFVQVISANWVSAPTIRIKIMYRWKIVGLAEFIGIVQSQQ